MKFSIKSIDILTENLCYTDYVIVTEEISNLELEIERLNNIIDQTQKILYIKLMNENKEKIYIQEVIDIIENLKGSDKE